jgi:hypothetical protein
MLTPSQIATIERFASLRTPKHPVYAKVASNRSGFHLEYRCGKEATVLAVGTEAEIEAVADEAAVEFRRMLKK